MGPVSQRLLLTFYNKKGCKHYDYTRITNVISHYGILVFSNFIKQFLRLAVMYEGCSREKPIGGEGGKILRLR